MDQKQKPVDIKPQPTTPEALRETRELLERSGVAERDTPAPQQSEEQRTPEIERTPETERPKVSQVAPGQEGVRPITTEFPSRDPARPSDELNSDAGRPDVLPDDAHRDE
jgi:hypothetical protein